MDDLVRRIAEFKEPKNLLWPLDPLCWQAVGKTRGWVAGEEYNGNNYENSHEGEWKRKWHLFITSLSIGKSIEESIKEL